MPATRDQERGGREHANLDPWLENPGKEGRFRLASMPAQD
jgi:hypothetical protein